MWDRVQVLSGKRKKPTSADALRLNIEEFSEEDMKHTKFLKCVLQFRYCFFTQFSEKIGGSNH